MNSHWRPLTSCAIALTLTLVSAGCSDSRARTAPGGGGLQIDVEGATVNAERRVEVTYRVTNGLGRSRGATGVDNRWTLARLGADPEGLPSYVALVLTGQQVTVDGVTFQQPSFETSGAVANLGDGRFRYTYATQLPEGYDPTATYRVGLFSRLDVTPSDPTDNQFDADAPNVVFDFVPAGGTPETREVVANDGCSACHVEIRAHGDFRRGVQICTTCHTFQLYDPDTTDPADPERPNPLDLGRMVHRIHRGNDLPTVATALDIARTAGPGDLRTAVLADPQATYSVIGFRDTEFVFGGVPRPGAERPQVLVSNGVERLAVEGVFYPQDIRNCAACHRPDAEDAAQILSSASKRSCRGCHVQTWFESATPPVAPSGTQYYEVHPAVGGVPLIFAGSVPSATCNGCHNETSPFVDARVTVAHVAPHHAPAYNPLVFTIVDVAGAAPGQNPVVTFEVADQNGPITDLAVLDTMNVTMGGPAQEFSYTVNFVSQPILSTVAGTKTVNATAVGGIPGRYQIAFSDRTTGPLAGSAAIPASATGTWAISLEGRRINAALTARERELGILAPTANFYDKPNNPVRYVAVTGSTPDPRRTVVTTAQCNTCHDVLSVHGGQRNETQYCVFCHAFDGTDWGSAALTGVTAGRPKIEIGGVPTVLLEATPDNIEERSIHLKNMIHKIHTGEDLVLSRPYAIYGFRSTLFYFDEVRVPLLARMRCTSCHVDETYTLEAMPVDTAPTIANETPIILHEGTTLHSPAENAVPPIRSACLSCHDTPFALEHAAAFTTGLTERCRECHTEGNVASVQGVHLTQ